MSDLIMNNKLIILDLIKDCKDLHNTLAEINFDNESLVELFEDNVHSLLKKAESFQDLKENVNQEILLSLENECTNLNNTLVVKYHTARQSTTISKLLIKAKYTIAILLSIFSDLSNYNNMNYNEETLHYLIAFIKTSLEFIIKDVFDKCLFSLLENIKALANQVCKKCSTKVTLEMLYAFYQLSLCQYQFEEANEYKKIIMNMDSSQNSEHVLEVMTTVYNVCVRYFQNQQIDKHKALYFDLIEIALHDIDCAIKNLTVQSVTLSEDLNKLKYSFLLLKANYFIKTNDLESANSTVDLIVAKKGFDKSTIMLKISLLKKVHEEDIETLVEKYIAILRDYIMSILLDKDYNTLSKLTEIFCDLCEYSSLEAINCSLYVLTSHFNSIPEQVKEKIFGNLVYMLTTKSKETLENKIQLGRRVFETTPQIFENALSEECANSIVVLVWNCSEPLIRACDYEKAKAWLMFLSIPQIKLSLNNQTYGLILRKLQVCNLNTNQFDEIYTIYEEAMNNDIQKDIKTQVIIFKAQCKEIEIISKDSITYEQIFERSLSRCKQILSMIQASNITKDEFYDTMYACFIDIKPNNPLLIDLLTYLLIESGEEEKNYSIKDLSKNFSYIRVLIIAIQMYTSKLTTSPDSIHVLKSNLSNVNILLKKSYDYLINFMEVKKEKNSILNTYESKTGSFGFDEICWLAAVSFNLQNMYYKNDVYSKDMKLCDLSTKFIDMIFSKESYTSKEMEHELLERKMRNVCLKVFYEADGGLLEKNEIKRILKELNVLIDAGSDANGNEKCVCEMQLAKLMLYNYFKDDEVNQMLNDVRVMKLMKCNDEFMRGCFYVFLNNQGLIQDHEFNSRVLLQLFDQFMINMELKHLLTLAMEFVSKFYENNHSELVVSFLEQVNKSTGYKLNNILENKAIDELEWLSIHCWNMSVCSLMDENLISNTSISQRWFDISISFAKNISSEKSEQLKQLRNEILL
ncbi:uncharacterized protein HGUI_00872 [Hanseniaspora guilliermondii]|uniref:Protein ZIP4 homolog n=1 Tax=Hanseniaspora guilliermondii TaxID=56406 RepID=A0A1L0AX60_9ASCO|nr:uncharacterized protein HGUI_00872 [Hanseniaspora guilliermondii]